MLMSVIDVYDKDPIAPLDKLLNHKCRMRYGIHKHVQDGVVKMLHCMVKHVGVKVFDIDFVVNTGRLTSFVESTYTQLVCKKTYVSDSTYFVKDVGRIVSEYAFPVDALHNYMYIIVPRLVYIYADFDGDML
jgi:hypothetical protein